MSDAGSLHRVASDAGRHVNHAGVVHVTIYSYRYLGLQNTSEGNSNNLVRELVSALCNPNRDTIFKGSRRTNMITSIDHRHKLAIIYNCAYDVGFMRARVQHIRPIRLYSAEQLEQSWLYSRSEACRPSPVEDQAWPLPHIQQSSFQIHFVL
jgi:hypothetical protein